MMKKDGGPAFPFGSISSGMTLRDYFAVKAMHGVLSDNKAIDVTTGKKITIPDDVDAIAYAVYEMADAMLKARQ